MVKKSTQDLYESNRYSRSLIALNLRDGDEVVNVFETNGKQDIFIATNLGYGLWFNESDVSPVGQRALGVIAIQLKDSDYVVNGQIIDEDISDLFVVTQRGACKRMKIDAFEKTSRARRGIHMLRELKTKPHRIVGFYTISQDEKISLVTDKENKIEVVPYGLPISDRH